MALIGCGAGQERPGPASSPIPTVLPSPTLSADTAAPTQSPALSSATPRNLGQVLVTRVIDGDTVVIEGGRRVRYIGMDTPEDTSVRECFGEEATRRNRELVEGRVVDLELDVSETDRFGRLLRYVWVGGEMVNEVLVAEGFASVSTFPPDVKYQERFLELQELARSSALGLWSVCAEGQSAPTIADGSGCDSSYPDVCIPSPPPDLDCPDITYRNFRVVGSDPHQFDGNNDGEACEGP